MTTARQSSPPAVRYRRRKRRSFWLLNLAIGVVLLLTIGLAGLLLFNETVNEPEPMLGPGTFPDAANLIRFKVLDGWEVIHAGTATRVKHQSGTFPDYVLAIKQNTQINLVVNWDCTILQERSASIAQAVLPWDVTLQYARIPCAEDLTIPTYGQLYVTLNDGTEQQAVVVFGPLDAQNWIVVYAGPFSGEASPTLVEAMTETVRSARRLS